MPVRIYDIAKKLGMESKEVLAKAKALGITAAKVPSSSLDKITAEYLEIELGGVTQALAPAPAPVSEPILILAPPPPVQPPPLPPPPEVEAPLVTEPVEEPSPSQEPAPFEVAATPVAPVS